MKKTYLPLQVTATLLMAWLAYGVYGDLVARYAGMISGVRLPFTLLVYVAFALGSAVIGLISIWKPALLSLPTRWRAALPAWLLWLIALALSAAVCWLFLYSKYSVVFSGFYVRLLIYMVAITTMAWLASARHPQPYTWRATLAAIIVFGSLFTLLYALRDVVDAPLGLEWSEGNRLWIYSTWFGEYLFQRDSTQRIYVYIDSARQILWGLPWLLGQISIVVARLWNAILFTVPYFVLGVYLVYDKKGKWTHWLLFGLWAMLFLNQGPIYTPLILSATLIAATRRTPYWLAFVLTILASHYAQAARSTWMFAPAIWVVLVWFLRPAERSASPGAFAGNPLGKFLQWDRLGKQWRQAFGLGIAGLIGAYVMPFLMINAYRVFIEGKQMVQTFSAEVVSSQVSAQPLLWDRLWPNATFAPGIVWGLVLAAGPLVVLLLWLIISGRWALTLWQKLCLAAAFFSTLTVGMIASVKIGGASNLHNLDMFLVTLVFSSGLAWNATREKPIFNFRSQPFLINVLLLAILIIPASVKWFEATPREVPDRFKVDEAINAIQVNADRYKPQGDILFIDQRQLLTFGDVTGVNLVEEYEKKHLMDMALSEDAGYFASFYKDLAAHRFSLIVTEPLHVMFQGGTYHFGNENDAWVKWVSIPVLCYYEPIETFREAGLELLVPRAEMEIPEGATACPQP